MARGPKKQLKRLNAPKHWMLDKLGGTWAPRPSTGPHKLRECLPLVLILRNRLKYALTRRECIMVVNRRLVKVDHKTRADMNYPVGFQDVVTIDKTDEHFRLLYDTKGRFVLHRVTPKEGQYKLLRVVKIGWANKASIGRNPFVQGRFAAIPYIVTHDGRTIRYPDPNIKVNDTVKFDLSTGKVTDHVKFDSGNVCFVTRGANVGRIATITSVEKHPGSYDIVHLADRRGNAFSTRTANVFVIGQGADPWISIPKAKGLLYSVIEERELRAKEAAKAASSKKKVAA
jgi:small subunit ribosomal protein S4e